MADITETIEELRALARHVDSIDKRASARMRDLAEAIDSGPQADQWANVDLFAIIDPNVLAEQAESRKNRGTLTSALELFRNAFILAPLIVTWYGISGAVEAYRALLTKRPDLLPQPFLLLWEDGFGGLLNGPTLSAVASVVVVLLAIVVFLTLGVYGLNLLAARNGALASEDLRMKLQQALSDAALILGERRRQQYPQGLASLFEESRRIVQQLDELTKFYATIADVTKDLQRAAKRFETAEVELSGSIRALAAPVTDLRDTQAKLLAATQDAATGLSHVVQEEKNIARTLADSDTLLAEVARDLGASSSDIKTLQKQANEALDGFRASVVAVVDGQAAFLGSMTEEREKQEQLTNLMYESARSFKDAFSKLRDVSNDLNSISVDLNRLASQARATVNQATRTP